MEFSTLPRHIFHEIWDQVPHLKIFHLRIISREWCMFMDRQLCSELQYLNLENLFGWPTFMYSPQPNEALGYLIKYLGDNLTSLVANRLNSEHPYHETDFGCYVIDLLIKHSPNIKALELGYQYPYDTINVSNIWHLKKIKSLIFNSKVDTGSMEDYLTSYLQTVPEEVQFGRGIPFDLFELINNHKHAFASITKIDMQIMGDFPTVSKTFPNLEELHLKYANLQSIGAADGDFKNDQENEIGHLKNLKKFTISDCRVPNISSLTKFFASIRELNLNYVELESNEDKTYKWLHWLPFLQKLSLWLSPGASLSRFPPGLPSLKVNYA